MIKTILKTFLVTAILMAASFSLLADPAVFAADSVSKDAACEAIALTGSGCDAAAGQKVDSVVGTIINLLSVVVGIAAVIMIIVSGFKYIASGGDAAKVGGAKTTLIYAIVGLVIVALAQFIVRIVIESV